MTLPIPDMTNWSILDFELAVDGYTNINNTALWLQNQPRAYDPFRMQYHAGSEPVVAIGEEYCGTILGQIYARLEAIRFDDPDDDDRRVRLLLIYHASGGSGGEPVERLLTLLEAWREPIAV